MGKGKPPQGPRGPAALAARNAARVEAPSSTGGHRQGLAVARVAPPHVGGGGRVATGPRFDGAADEDDDEEDPRPVPHPRPLSGGVDGDDEWVGDGGGFFNDDFADTGPSARKAQRVEAATEARDTRLAKLGRTTFRDADEALPSDTDHHARARGRIVALVARHATQQKQRLPPAHGAAKKQQPSRFRR